MFKNKSLILISGVLLTVSAGADTIELSDGTTLEGDLIGSSNNIIMFQVGDDIQAYPESEVVGIYLSAGVETRDAEASSQAVVVPAGTRLVIRMADSIDSKRHKAGHRFRGQLEGAIAIDGTSVIPRGTFVYGQITEAEGSGRLAGKAALAITFTDFMIDDQLIPITTTGLRAQSDNEAKNTAGRTARAAVIGALIGGSSGAKTGAAIGVGASILTSG
ncbi:MAG: hypothetical protein OEU86_05445, partial [Gammaproteobacteria bacterium]|nr:hypothetical protein [Gammaproteobacteria bacterium]